jgi:hypothetical protein
MLIYSREALLSGKSGGHWIMTFDIDTRMC